MKRLFIVGILIVQTCCVITSEKPQLNVEQEKISSPTPLKFVQSTGVSPSPKKNSGIIATVIGQQCPPPFAVACAVGVSNTVGANLEQQDAKFTMLEAITESPKGKSISLWRLGSPLDRFIAASLKNTHNALDLKESGNRRERVDAQRLLSAEERQFLNEFYAGQKWQ